MSKDELFIWLDSKLDETRCMDNLNFGGCCVYAVMMAEALTKLGVDAKIKACGSGDIQEAAMECGESAWDQDWEAWGVDFGHVFVEFTVDGSTYWLDGWVGYVEAATHAQRMGAARELGLSLNGIADGRVEYTAMQGVAGVANNWNPSFCRTRNIPILSKLLDVEWNYPIEENSYAY